jgi:hypothetical protein
LKRTPDSRVAGPINLCLGKAKFSQVSPLETLSGGEPEGESSKTRLCM